MYACVSGSELRILSGGQYDLLVARMGKQGGAVGFAVYLDQMEGLDNNRPTYDVDTLIVVEHTPSAVALKVAHGYIQKGQRVLVVKALPQDMTAQYTIYLDEKGEVTNANT